MSTITKQLILKISLYITCNKSILTLAMSSHQGSGFRKEEKQKCWDDTWNNSEFVFSLIKSKEVNV